MWQNFEDYVEMTQLPYIYDVYFAKDDKVRVPTDLAQLQQMLEHIEPGSTHGFMSFLLIFISVMKLRKYF